MDKLPGGEKKKFPLWQLLISIAMLGIVYFYLGSVMLDKDNQFRSAAVDKFAPSLSQEAKLEGAWLRLSGPVESVVFSRDRSFHINYGLFGSDINHDYHISGDKLNYSRDGVDYTTRYKLENNVLTLSFGDVTCTFRKAD